MLIYLYLFILGVALIINIYYVSVVLNARMRGITMIIIFEKAEDDG